MSKRPIFPTDQFECYDAEGKPARCQGEQDPAGAGQPWPSPRFSEEGQTVNDGLTGLVWTQDGAVSMFPMMWADAFDLVTRMNKINAYGYSDWRLPNRREMFSLISHVRNDPALPREHPFVNAASSWYWTSTTAARVAVEAWKVHMGSGRMKTAPKHEMAMIWPVRGGRKGQIRLHWTGQRLCYSQAGNIIDCENSGQDGELRVGAPWPSPRFTQSGQTVLDLLTGLTWTHNANCAPGLVPWEQAFEAVSNLNKNQVGGHGDWRAPTVRELESITDMGGHSPALIQGRPFINIKDYYWSSSTVANAPDRAWVLETGDGAVTHRSKGEKACHVWAVRA
ncbi:DUF1566 domain-containing protein [Desulfatibacillum aliphaticivorans]|uniref:Lcl C-terminal domain-containing protein n=1 Tax=Desulfatibacillum aliphaticivorans TaxID=218208 RepID=UPI00041EEB82|nr:DUF1566 domain-containing protein [Desulfatibacillum aliphaticivorans]